MGGFWFFILFGLLIYVIIQFNTLKKRLDEYTFHIHKLDVRIRELEVKQLKSEIDAIIPAEEFDVSEKEIVIPEKEPEESEVLEEFEEDYWKIPTEVVETTPEETANEEEKVEATPEEIPSPIIEAETTKSEPRFAAYERSIVEVRSQAIPKAVVPPVIKKKNEFWTRIEKQFVENWTGILGSVIMVVGVGFLGIYTAVKISPLGRFLMISGFSALLAGLFFFLYKKPKWTKLALWMRSSAGAIFLFACAASVAIPGLKWVEAENLQLVILLLGVVVNLFLGYIGKNQGLASLHVLLSLVAVCIIPASATLLIVGTVITLFGVALTYREKWDYHLLLTASSFFAFHLFYWYSVQQALTSNDRIVGIISIVLVGISVALVHYREAYSKKNFERVPFIVHLLNWFYFGLGLVLYSQGSRVSTIILAAGAIAAFVLARRAKKLEIRWLYVSDTLIAQLTAVIALITLFRWELDLSVILAAIFMECLLFLVIARREKDNLLYQIGSAAICIIGVVLCWFSISLILGTDGSLLFQQVGAILASAIAGTAYLFYINKFNIESDADISTDNNKKIVAQHAFLSIVIGSLFVTSYLDLFAYNWSIYLFVVLLLGVLFIRNKVQNREFSFIAIIFLLGTHLVNWIKLVDLKNESASEILVVGLPLLIVSAFVIKYSFVKISSKYLNWIGVYLFAIQLTILSYFLFEPISTLSVSFAFLGLLFLAIVLVQLLAKKSVPYHQIDRYILHVGYALIALFLIQHLLFNFQNKEIWGPIKGRIWVEICAIAVFIYWAIAKNETQAEYQSWKTLHPVLVELVLVFSFISLSHEIDYTYIPLVFLAMAGITLALSIWKNKNLGRLAFYSFVLYVVALVQQLFVYASVYRYSGGISSFQSIEFVLACIFIVSALIYLIAFYKRAVLSDIHWPILVQLLGPFGDILNDFAAILGVYSFGAFLMLMTYYMFDSASVVIPGIVWLLLSAIFATAAVFTYEKKSNFVQVDRYMLHLCYFFIGAFLLRHLFVHLYLERMIGAVKIRYLLEGLAIIVFAYCAMLKKPENATYKSWTYLHPLFVELLILFSAFTVAYEIDHNWQPMIWVATSFIFAVIGNKKDSKLSRLLFYSLVMYWIAAFQTAFATSSQSWIYGSVSLLLQFAFLLYFYLKCSLEKVILPKPLSFLGDLIASIQKHINVFVFYPLIICTAIFLFWTFDKSLLTLLWVIESLVVFVISIVLRKHHFRYVALAALAMCIVRLIFFDLAQSSTLSRAIVFLSVGIIMLVMNSLYNKFKSRFE